MNSLRSRRALLFAACGVTLVAAAPAVRAGETLAGRGPVQAQVRTPGAFTGVALRMPAEVEVSAGATDTVTVETSRDLLPLVETIVVRDTVVIRLREGVSGVDAAVLRIKVQARRIDALAVAGSGSIKAESLRSPSLKLSVTGSGSLVAARLHCGALDAAVAGSGSITVDGEATAFTASLAGSGDLMAARLRSDVARVSLAGSGTATVWTTGELVASLLGSGDVRYYGRPKLRISTLGSGAVRRVADAPS
jgi:hypothetical protein